MASEQLLDYFSSVASIFVSVQKKNSLCVHEHLASPTNIAIITTTTVIITTIITVIITTIVTILLVMFLLLPHSAPRMRQRGGGWVEQGGGAAGVARGVVRSLCRWRDKMVRRCWGRRYLPTRKSN